MMLLASSVRGLFKWRQFEPEVILLAVGWYVRFSLSYREVEELLAERGLLVDHVTVWRWVEEPSDIMPPINIIYSERRVDPTSSLLMPEAFLQLMKVHGDSNPAGGQG